MELAIAFLSISAPTTSFAQFNFDTIDKIPDPDP